MASLTQALKTACLQLNGSIHEEEGGFILRKEDDYMFVQVRNENTGTPIAQGLYSADKAEFGEKIVKKFMEGWQLHASFHTHPDGYGNRPSRIDLTRLFQGFPINYIYSPDLDSLAIYTFNKDEKMWYGDLVDLEPAEEALVTQNG